LTGRPGLEPYSRDNLRNSCTDFCLHADADTGKASRADRACAQSCAARGRRRESNPQCTAASGGAVSFCVTTLTQNVPSIYAASSQHFHSILITFTQHAHCIQVCTASSIHLQSMLTTFTRHSHYIYTSCSLHLHIKFTTLT
jgi:hypothetical protein